MKNVASTQLLHWLECQLLGSPSAEQQSIPPPPLAGKSWSWLWEKNFPNTFALSLKMLDLDHFAFFNWRNVSLCQIFCVHKTYDSHCFSSIYKGCCPSYKWKGNESKQGTSLLQSVYCSQHLSNVFKNTMQSLSWQFLTLIQRCASLLTIARFGETPCINC